MTIISSQIFEIIEKVCTSIHAEVGSKSDFEEIDKALRWISPFISIYPERPEQDIEFSVDFQMTKVGYVLNEYQTDYLVVTLYLVGGDANLLPCDRASLGNRLVGINELNREEPGVKFRFQPSESSDERWIVIESDVRVDVDGLDEKTLKYTLDRLLECAEVRYYEVYKLAVGQG